ILIKGFYNFSLSIALFFWLAELWLRYLENRKKGTLVTLFLLSVILFFTHPLAFAFGGFVCFALTISVILSRPAISRREKIRHLIKNCLTLFLCLLPGIILVFKFMNNEGGS